MIKVRSLPTALMVTFLALIGCKVVADDGEPGSYQGSLELPDGIAYQTFLDMLDGLFFEPESGYRYVARAMGLDLDEAEERQQVESYTAFFLEKRKSLEWEQAQRMYQILCNVDMNSRTFDEVAEALDGSSKIRNDVARSQLVLILELFNDRERSSFTAFLDEVKKSTSYTTIDSAFHYERMPERGIWEDAEDMCGHYLEVMTQRELD